MKGRPMTVVITSSIDCPVCEDMVIVRLDQMVEDIEDIDVTLEAWRVHGPVCPGPPPGNTHQLEDIS